MTLGRFGAVVFCLAVGVSGTGAQTVTVAFQDGRVTLTAQNATPGQILAEWAKVGGTRIVNGDRVPGTPMTIELVDVSERQALDVILRSASGYMAAARTSGSGASGLDRVHILPTSAAAPARPSAAPPARQSPYVPRPAMPAAPNPARVAPGRIVGGQPGGNQAFPASPNAPQGVDDGMDEDFDDDIDLDDDLEDGDQPTSATPTPGNPFGVAPGSVRPGVVNPQPPRPGQTSPSPSTRGSQPNP